MELAGPSSLPSGPGFPVASPGAALLNRFIRRKPVISVSTEEADAPSLLASRAAEEGEKVEAEQQPVEEETKRITVERSPPDNLSRLRPTSLRTTAYLRYRVAQDNRILAEEAKNERDERLMRKEEEDAERVRQGREQVAERIKRQERSRKHRQDLLRQRLQQVALAKEREVRERQRLEHQRAQLQEEARARVLETSGLQERLEQTEAAAETERGAEGKRSKDEVARAVAEVRQQLLTTKQQMASQIKQLHGKASKEQMAQLDAAAAARVNEKREASRQWGLERGKREYTYIERARENRDRAFHTRQAAKAAVTEVLEVRKRAAAKERANDERVTQERAKILASNKREVAVIYRSRYVSKAAAHEFDESGWKRLYGQWFGVKDGAKGSSSQDAEDLALGVSRSTQEIQQNQQAHEKAAKAAAAISA